MLSIVSTLTSLAAAQRVAYISNAAGTGSQGGVAGVDTICNNDADGTFGESGAFGVVGTVGTDLCLSLPANEAIINVDSEPVADNGADFVDGTIDNPIDKSYNGNLQAGLVWTGFDQTNTCNDWTTANPGVQGNSGSIGSTASTYLSLLGTACSGSQKFLCITGEVPSRMTCEDMTGEGDPHFVGFDGSHFDFSGEANHVYNLISEPFLNLNMRVVGLTVKGQNGTWMETLAFRFGEDAALVIDANGQVVINEEKLVADDGHFAVTDLVSVAVSSARRMVTVQTPTYRFTVSIRKEGYLNLRTSIMQQPENPHGILGQTASFLLDGSDPTPIRSKLANGADLLAGSYLDYEESALLSTDSRFNTYEGIVDTSASSSKRFEANFKGPVRSSFF